MLIYVLLTGVSKSVLSLGSMAELNVGDNCILLQKKLITWNE
jgi:hypothetical protein